MSKRDVIKDGICVISALALLVAVMTSPIRPSRAAGGSSHLGCLRRNFATPPTHSACPSATSLTSPPGFLKAVRSESEEERRGTESLGCCPFDLSITASSEAIFPDLAAPGHIPASRPLRC